jgi:hypothetical protein
MFQIVRLTLDDSDNVVVRRPLQPFFDASRLWGDYGRDEEQDCWWATDSRGKKYRFVVEQVMAADVAA